MATRRIWQPQRWMQRERRLSRFKSMSVIAALLNPRWPISSADGVACKFSSITLPSPKQSRSWDITSAEFDAVMAVNLRGTFQACQVFGKYFRDRGYGRIINMASLAGQNGGTATGAHYAASKAGIIALTKVFARDLGKFGVTVNAIAPGPLDLPMVHRTVPADKMAELRQAIPVGDIGNPAFIGRLIGELASPDAAFATGATWDVNGGLYMR